MKTLIKNKYSLVIPLLVLFFIFFTKPVSADIIVNDFVIDDDEQTYQGYGTDVSVLVEVPEYMNNPSLICYITERNYYTKEKIASVKFGGDELTEIWSAWDNSNRYHYFWWIKNPKKGSYHLTFTKENYDTNYFDINCRAIQGVGGIGNILTQGNFTGTQFSPYEHTYQTDDFATDSLLLAWSFFQDSVTSTQDTFFSVSQGSWSRESKTIYQAVENNNNRVTWLWDGKNYYGTSKIIELTKADTGEGGGTPVIPDDYEYSFPIDKIFNDFENDIIYSNNEDVLVFENLDLDTFEIYARFWYPENYLDYTGGFINMVLRDKERNFIKTLPTTKAINSNNLPSKYDFFVIDKDTGFEMNTCQAIEIVIQFDKGVINHENIIICLYEGEMPDSDKFFLNQSEIDQNFPFQKTYNKLSNKIIFGTFIKLEQNVKNLFNQLKDTSRAKNSNMKLYFDGQSVDLLEIKDNSTKGIYDFIYNISTIVFYSLFIVYIIFRARTFISND